MLTKKILPPPAAPSASTASPPSIVPPLLRLLNPSQNCRRCSSPSSGGILASDFSSTANRRLQDRWVVSFFWVAFYFWIGFVILRCFISTPAYSGSWSRLTVGQIIFAGHGSEGSVAVEFHMPPSAPSCFGQANPLRCHQSSPRPLKMF